MGSPLMWRACIVAQRFYDVFPGYRHKITLDGHLEGYTVEKNCRKIICFYLSFIPVSIIIISSLIVVRGAFQSQHERSNSLVFLSVLFIGLFSLGISLNWVSIRNADELLLSFYRRLWQHGQDFSTPLEKRYKLKCSTMTTAELTRMEFWKIVSRDPTADVVGFQTMIFTVFAIGAGSIFPLGVFLNVDPMYGACNIMFHTNIGISSTPIRLLIGYWAGLELSRTVIMALAPAMSIFNIASKVLIIIKNFGVRNGSLKMHSALQVLNVFGHQGIRETAAVLMAFGFIIVVFSNVILLTTYQSLPIIVYACRLLINIVTYIVLFQTLPMAIKCFILSELLCKKLWYYELAELRHIMTQKAFKTTKRVIKSHKPIYYYYGTARYDTETQANYYHNIFKFTTDMILLK